MDPSKNTSEMVGGVVDHRERKGRMKEKRFCLGSGRIPLGITPPKTGWCVINKLKFLPVPGL